MSFFARRPPSVPPFLDSSPTNADVKILINPHTTPNPDPRTSTPDKLDGFYSRARVYIVVVTPSLYRSKACLEEIFFGMKNKKIKLMLPVLFGTCGVSRVWGAGW